MSQLLTLMDGLKARSHVIVMGATNRPNRYRFQSSLQEGRMKLWWSGNPVVQGFSVQSRFSPVSYQDPHPWYKLQVT